MAVDTNLEAIQKILVGLLTDDIFLVEIKVKPINNIKIFLDADAGLGIEKCTRINRRLYRQVEEMGFYPEGDFSIEVSSPGLDAPLKLHRQYVKNIGRDVEVTLNDAAVKEGKLLDVTEEQITIETTEGKGKKAVTQQIIIALTDVKQTLVQIKF